MASYSTMNTLPSTAVEAETPLLQRDIKINAKTLVGGAAVAAFALGALGATAVSSPAAPPAPAALYTSSSYDASWTNIELSSDTSKCLAGSESNVPLSVVDCAPHFGVFEQDRYADGTFTLKSGSLCVTGLRDDSPDFELGQPFGLFTCSDAYADYQLFESTGSDIKLASSDICVTTDGTKVLAAVCGGRDQSFNLAQHQPIRTKPPTPRPAPRPRPRPSPRPSHKPKVGTNSDQDKHHNCCGGGGECGWHWCSSSKSCKRFGECSKDDKPLVGGDVDKHGCKGSAGEYWNGSECANVRGD